MSLKKKKMLLLLLLIFLYIHSIPSHSIHSLMKKKKIHSSRDREGACTVAVRRNEHGRRSSRIYAPVASLPTDWSPGWGHWGPRACCPGAPAPRSSISRAAGAGGATTTTSPRPAAGGRGARRRVEEVEEGVGGVRACDWGRGGVAGRVVGGGGCWGAPRGGAEVLFELVAVGGAELDAGWVAAQHWRMRRWEEVRRRASLVLLAW